MWKLVWRITSERTFDVVGACVSQCADKVVSTAGVFNLTGAAVTLATSDQTVLRSVIVTSIVTVRVWHNLTIAFTATTIHRSVLLCVCCTVLQCIQQFSHFRTAVNICCWSELCYLTYPVARCVVCTELRHYQCERCVCCRVCIVRTVCHCTLL